MFKKLLLAVLLLFFCLLFAGCGSEKTVPEQTTNQIVDDYLIRFGTFAGTHTSYQAVINHNPEGREKTDVITIELTISFPHIVTASSYEATYRYDGSRKVWDLVNGGSWSPIRIKSCDLATKSDLWISTLQQMDYQPTEEKEIFNQFNEGLQESSIDMSTIEDGWVIEDNDILVLFYDMDTNYDAQNLFQFFQDSAVRMGLETNQTQEGDNYVFALFIIPKEYAEYADFQFCECLIRQDDKLFFISANADFKVLNILKEAGFILGYQ